MNLRLIATDDTGTIFENCYGYHIDSRMRTSSSKSTKTCDNRQRDIEVASREVDSTRIGRPIGSGIETGHRCDEIIDEDLSSEANGSRSLGRGKTETSAGGARSDDGTRNTDTVAERIREKRDNNPHQRELEGEVEDKNRQDRRSAQRDVQEETNRSQIAAEKRRAGRDTGDAMAAAVAAVEEKKEGEKKVEGDGERRNPGENPYQQCRGKERETRLSDSNAEKIDRLDRVEERSVRMETSRKPAKRLERDEHGRRDQRENEKNPAARQNRKKEERDKDGEADATPLSKSKDPASKRTTDSPGDAEKGRSALNEEGKLPVSNRRHKEASTERGSGSKETGERTAAKKLPQDVNHKGVFACNELDLKEVQVYGFDYDYTLACYKPSMDYLLYNLGRDMLIKRYKYPEGIANLEYRENFAVRGLHYDIEKGLLLKLDSFLQIQLGAVYRGLHPVPDEEVLRIYKNRIIPIAYVEAPHKQAHNALHRSKMVQLADLFSVPEMSLLCNVTEYFLQNHIDYHPEILFRDVKNSVQSCHPIMHHLVVENVSEYLEQNKDLRRFLDRLQNAGKKTFLVTNSPFHFVNKGMQFLVGENWKDYFDVVIVQARKPKFFTEETRPLRIYNEVKQTQLWDRVTKLEKGIIYLEGTVKQLQDMTGWRGHQVLYFGDHPYSDLADVTLEHGWRTGAIIKELTHEIETLNNPKFKENANWLQMLTCLIEEHQDYVGPEVQSELDEWMKERDQLRNEIKSVFNKQFGSVFRTYHNPTYFSRRLFRFADIYMSSITNLLEYSTSHTFYPRRGVMPHEYTSYFV